MALQRVTVAAEMLACLAPGSAKSFACFLCIVSAKVCLQTGEFAIVVVSGIYKAVALAKLCLQSTSICNGVLVCRCRSEQLPVAARPGPRCGGGPAAGLGPGAWLLCCA